MPATIKGKYDDVLLAVNHVLGNQTDLDAVVSKAVARIKNEVAKELAPLTNKRVEEGRNQLLKDVEDNFNRVMKQVADAATGLERDQEARLAAAEAKHNIKIEITQAEGGKTKTKKLEGLFHKDIPLLITMLKTGNPIVLTGPTQSSKSKSIGLAAEALDKRVMYHSFGPTQTETAIAGFVTASGTFAHRSLYLCARYGGVWVGDEADVVADAGVIIWMNNLISNGEASFPLGTKSDALLEFEKSIGYDEKDVYWQHVAGGTFTVHPDFQVVLTMNTYGEGGDAAYRGRRGLDRSTLARFDFLYWGYDESLERKLALRAAPPSAACPSEVVNDWVTWCQALRLAVKEERLDDAITISPSHTIRGAKNLAAGLSWEQASKFSLLPGELEDATRTRVVGKALAIYEDATGRSLKYVVV